MNKIWTKLTTKKQPQGIDEGDGDKVNCQLIHGDHLKVIRDIGEGQYGFVKLGEWTQNSGKKRLVAIKYLRDSATQLTNEIVKEASVMQTLQHENILIFHGISFPMDGQPQLRLVIEFSPLGSLLDNLKKGTPGIRQVTTLGKFAVQIAAGMQYLASRKLVHRDLATRNILVFENEVVKVGDFGLARAMGNCGVLEVTMGRRMAFAWCSPETLSKSLYSLASDVWSYGVTLWEMYSFGEVPWNDLDLREVLKIVTTVPVRRLEKPRACPDGVYDVMISCWQDEPQKRPTFQDIYKRVEECHPKQVITKTFHKSTNEDLLNYREKDIITVISSSNKESGVGLWLGQHENDQIGLFEKKNVKSYKKRDKKRGKSFNSDAVPHPHSGTVRYGAPAPHPEGDEEEGEEEEDITAFREPNYEIMNPARRGSQQETENEPAHDLDHDEYVSIHADNAALRHGYSVPRRPTPADDILIPQTPRLENGASQSVPTSHAFPSEHELRSTSADDMSTAATSNEPSQLPSWATLPRKNPPKIPERVDLMTKRVPNGEGAGGTSHERADAPNGVVKRKTPIPTPRKKTSSGTNPRVEERPKSYPAGDETSLQSEPIMANFGSEEQGPQRGPASEMGPSDNRVPPLGAEDDPLYMSQKGPSEDSELIYERPWVVSNPMYDVPRLSERLTSETKHVYAQPAAPQGRTVRDDPVPGNHFYDLPNIAAQQGTADHIYERPDVLLPSARHQSNTVGQEPASPPLPPKDIMSRDTVLETTRLPEPLRPVPLSPTSPTTTGGFCFTPENHSDMTSSSTSVRAAATPVAEQFYDRPFVPPPPPEIPEETLRRPPPENPFGESPFLGGLDSSFSGMTLEFRQAHSLHERATSEGVEGSSVASPDDLSSLDEEQQTLIKQVRAVWAGVDVDWCCAAFMECDGDLTQILEMAKVEQVHCITGKVKEHCKFTLKHCNWDVDRAVNWILDEGLSG